LAAPQSAKQNIDSKSPWVIGPVAHWSSFETIEKHDLGWQPCRRARDTNPDRSCDREPTEILPTCLRWRIKRSSIWNRGGV